MGNGAKAQTTRNRKGNTDKAKKPSSQLKSNIKAQNKICAWCLQPLQSTAKSAELEDHAKKHGKTFEECWPSFNLAEMKATEQANEAKKTKKAPAAK
ncbi:hypothetical protein SLS62_006890 [Diatrype stigma]|uniref:At2g23090-like zinc-binding domain-containing protein n=1 Tax=Diatrype stigma TaxID=117547 RepID=A0AAN9YRA8_9PEZI